MHRETINSSLIPLLSCIHASAHKKVIGSSFSYLQVPGKSPGYLSIYIRSPPLAKELNIFVNKSSNRGGKAR